MSTRFAGHTRLRSTGSLLAVALAVALVVALVVARPKSAEARQIQHVLSPRAQLAKAQALLRATPRRRAWKNVRWGAIRARALHLLDDPNALDQAALHLCGGACVLSGLAATQPLRFAKLVREIYEKGEVRGLHVTKPLLDAQPAGARTLDWMLLSATRNAYGRPSFRGQAGFVVSAINLPADVKRWAVELAGFARVRSHSSFLTSGARHIGRVNDALRRKGRDVFLLMHMKGLRAAQGHDLHWVRLLSPVAELPPASAVAASAGSNGDHIVGWVERDGTRGERAFADAASARRFAKTLGKPRVRFTIFDRGRALPAHLSRARFGEMVLQTLIAEP